MNAQSPIYPFTQMATAETIEWGPPHKSHLDFKEAAMLSNVLRRNHLVRELCISCPMAPEAAAAIAAAMREHPSLSVVRFKGQQLSQPELQLLADAAFSLPALRTFQMKESGIEAPLMRHICAEAGAHENLQRLCLSKNTIATTQLPDISALFRDKHNWESLRFMDCGLDEHGITHIARQLGAQPKLCRFHLQGNVPDKGLYPAFSEAVLNTKSQNLMSVFPNTPPIQRLCEQNETYQQDVLNKLRHVFLNKLGASVTTNAQALHLLPSLRESLRVSRFQTQFETYMKELPPLPAAPSTQNILRRSNSLKQCAAENPANWQHAEDLLSQLEAQGETINHAWLNKTTPQGETLLTCGLAGGGKAFVEALNERGITLRANELLHPQNKHQPNAALRALIELNNCNALFGFNNWQGASAEEMKALYRVLPPESRADVQYHQLANSLGEHAAAQNHAR